MSDKTSTIDQLGNSEFPSDLLTSTLGSGFGVGEYPDMEYGMGVLEAVFDPELLPSPALPTGLTRGAAEDMDLTEMLQGEELADLNWLNPTVSQDPERLPHSTNDTIIPELVEAWGVNRRTDGRGHVSRDLNQARYEESLTADAPQTKKATTRQMRAVVAHAMRRSAEGQDIEVVCKQALESMGEEMGRIAPFIRRVRAEHGLAGNVYIRASAYPGYGTGKWSTAVKKHASRARYVLVSASEMEQATWIQNGRCGYTGKHAVTQIPWKEAADFYFPRFEARIAALVPTWEGSDRDRLQRAFLEIPSKNSSQTWLPQHSEAVREGFLADKKLQIEDPQVQHLARKTASAHAQIKRWARDGFFSQEACNRILAAEASPERKVQAGVRLIKLAQSRDFSGAVNQGQAGSQALLDARLQATRSRAASSQAEVDQRGAQKDAALAAREARRESEVNRALEQASEWLRTAGFSGAPNQGQAGDISARRQRREGRQARVARHDQNLQRVAAERAEERVKVAVRKVARVIKSGLRGKRLAEEIRRLIPADMVPSASKYLDPLLTKTGALEELDDNRTYEGTQFQRAVAKKASPDSLRNVRAGLRYVRQAMSEGYAGARLDELIGQRFSDRVQTAMADGLQELRQAHEGGAGFLYVEASAYASPTGMAGCEKGALKHRANALPAVAAMDRCAGCNMVRTLENGTRKCGTYNKAILEDTTGPELQQLKTANVRVANMSDGEQTQSMFAPAYDAAEFGLRNSNLEGVSPDFPEHEKVAEVIFGGWDF